LISGEKDSKSDFTLGAIGDESCLLASKNDSQTQQWANGVPAYRSRRIGSFVGEEWYRALRLQWWSGFGEYYRWDGKMKQRRGNSRVD
jgi:hypothetical protein